MLAYAAGDSIASQNLLHGGTASEAASNAAAAVRQAGEYLLKNHMLSMIPQGLIDSCHDLPRQHSVAVLQKASLLCNWGCTRLTSVTVDAAADSLKSQKVPEAASEAASNFATAVRDAGGLSLTVSASVIKMPFEPGMARVMQSSFAALNLTPNCSGHNREWPLQVTQSRARMCRKLPQKLLQTLQQQ